MILADIELARRLERTEGEAGAKFIQARTRLTPGRGSACTTIGGTYAMFDGPESPITQTFCLGMFDEPSVEQMEQIEEFFTQRNAPVLHEVSPQAHPAALALLNERGYFPAEFTSVMFLPLRERLPHEGTPDSEIRVRTVKPEEAGLWARTSAEGWREYSAAFEQMMQLGKVIAAREDGPSFLAELHGAPIATAAMFVHQGVALMAGASTIPSARNQGAQQALIEARIQYAEDAGCDLLMMCAQPGSGSQRNAERLGFRIAYTRIKWQMRAR